MSIDFYPSVLKDREDGTKCWENVVPMQGDADRVKAEARMNPAFEGDAFEPNPEYFPFSTLNMTNGNGMAILRLIGLHPDTTEYSGNLPIREVFEAAHNFMFRNNRVRDMEQYTLERVFALREMARLGITRGATHIVWA